MSLFILLPTQLFEYSFIRDLIQENDIQMIWLLEHPIYFGLDEERKMLFNKMKFVLHRSSLLAYEEYLKKELLNSNIKIQYIKVNDYIPKKLRVDAYSFKEIYYIDCPDYLVDKRLKECFKQVPKKIIKYHPNFIYSVDDLEAYTKKTKKKTYFHKSFYEWGRKRLNVLMEPESGKPVGGQFSYDPYNRASIPEKTVTIPSLPPLSKGDKRWIEQGIQEIEQEFGKYPGCSKLYLPVTLTGAKKWLDKFIKERLNQFGKYEDAVLKGEPFLFHSILSPLINIGLLNPLTIIKEVEKVWNESDKSNTELLHSIEGFIRQIMGWREWQRYLYIYEYNTLKNSNFYENKRRLTSHWYDGTLGIDPIDDTIQMAYKKGYLHHILRLMYMANFMTLCQIHPHQMYEWFMSFSMDSYDWVMTQNIYAMGSGGDGGLTMTKPYITTSNYIVEMSNYKEKKGWMKIWNALYYNFIMLNIKKLEAYPRISGFFKMNLKRKTQEELDDYATIANTFLNEYTTLF